MENEYLQQVMSQKAELERDLQAPQRKLALRTRSLPGGDSGGGGRGDGEGSPAVDVRITGLWRWRNVVVPPNAYVVHTRRGRPDPVHVGVGISFRFNPYTDAFLVVPAAMQTIVLTASCICRERQGVVVQGYVQWIIDDFAKAYRKLDFSDPVDPMRIVNVQLREQAEATIKDAVATMSIDAVLADKQPIIEELTRRLRAVAEGEGGADGLGLRIVTVQIKEAVVCSTRLWETLQRPFRAERAKLARVAELEHAAVVRTRESQEASEAAAQQIERESVIRTMRAEAEARAFDRECQEQARRARLSAEAASESHAAERQTAQLQAELTRARLELQLAERALTFEAQAMERARETELYAARQAVENAVTDVRLRSLLIEKLPEIAGHLPKPSEVKSVQIGNLDALSGLVAGVLEVVDRLRNRPPGSPP